MPLVPAKSYVAMANVSNVKCDGEVIKGLQSIDWKIVKRRSNVHNIGIHERVGIDYGDMYVTGVLRVRSAFPKFDKYMGEEKPFQLVAELKELRMRLRRIGAKAVDEAVEHHCEARHTLAEIVVKVARDS